MTAEAEAKTASIALSDPVEEGKGNVSSTESVPSTTVAPVRKSYLSMLFRSPVAAGYALLSRLQSHVRSHLNMFSSRDPGASKRHWSDAAFLFGFCATCLYVGVLLFRIVGNFVRHDVNPAVRVTISYAVLGSALLCAVLRYCVRRVVPRPQLQGK